MVNSDSVSQVVLNGGKTNSSFTLAAPHKSTGSGSSEEENEGDCDLNSVDFFTSFPMSRPDQSRP